MLHQLGTSYAERLKSQCFGTGTFPAADTANFHSLRGRCKLNATNWKNLNLSVRISIKSPNVANRWMNMWDRQRYSLTNIFLKCVLFLKIFVTQSLFALQVGRANKIIFIKHLSVLHYYSRTLCRQIKFSWYSDDDKFDAEMFFVE